MPILKVREISSADRKRVKTVSFDVYEGEVLGFAGLIGSGRTDLMNCMFGVQRHVGGTITFRGRDITLSSPYEALRNGMAYITESRRQNGFMPNLGILENMVIPARVKAAPFRGSMALVSQGADRSMVERACDRLAVKRHSIDQLVTELSGGNQQKVLIGKWVATLPDIILFDEPTRGVDVGAKAEIYRIIRELVT